MLKTTKWIGFDFDNNRSYHNREGTDESDEMKQFYRDFRSDLKKEMGSRYLRIIKISKNYWNITAFVSDPDEKSIVYVSLGDMRYCNKILIRSASSPDDYTGGANHYTSLDRVYDDIAELISWHLKNNCEDISAPMYLF